MSYSASMLVLGSTASPTLPIPGNTTQVSGEEEKKKAVREAARNGTLKELVGCCLKIRKADIDAINPEKDSTGNSALHQACMSTTADRERKILYLLQMGANPFKKNKRGESPWELLIRKYSDLVDKEFTEIDDKGHNSFLQFASEKVDKSTTISMLARLIKLLFTYVATRIQHREGDKDQSQHTKTMASIENSLLCLSSVAADREVKYKSNHRVCGIMTARLARDVMQCTPPQDDNGNIPRFDIIIIGANGGALGHQVLLFRDSKDPSISYGNPSIMQYTDSVTRQVMQTEEAGNIDRDNLIYVINNSKEAILYSPAAKTEIYVGQRSVLEYLQSYEKGLYHFRGFSNGVHNFSLLNYAENEIKLFLKGFRAAITQGNTLSFLYHTFAATLYTLSPEQRKIAVKECIKFVNDDYSYINEKCWNNIQEWLRKIVVLPDLLPAFMDDSKVAAEDRLCTLVAEYSGKI